MANLADWEHIDHVAETGEALRLQDMLSFDGIRSRERAIDDALSGTCLWFRKTAQYHAWASQPLAEWHHGLLWLKGNAGAGKSTIMKSAVDSESNHGSALVLPHFFNARGTVLQQSAEGMYRTLLFWLLGYLPAHVKKDLQEKYSSHQTNSWPVPELERMLRDVLSRVGHQPVSIYIDALDECSRQDVRRMLRTFRDVVKDAWNATPKRQVRVLFASRPYPHTSFDDAIYMDLSDQEEHVQDISRYIDSELCIGEGARATAVRQALLKKAAGVFMWVVLVVETLNNDYDGGIVKLEQRLREIPTGLHKLYRYILDRYPEDRDELRECLRWLLFGHEDKWEIEQLWWAIQLSLGQSDEEICREYEVRTEHDIARYITRASKGFVECKYIKTRNEKMWPDNFYHIQLIHESVRDFIFKDVELRDLYEVNSRQLFEAKSQQKLRDACFAEISARRSELSDLSFIDLSALGWMPKKEYYKRGRTRFPMAAYSAKGIVLHAEAAQKCGLDQKDFIAKCERELGPNYLIVKRSSLFRDEATPQVLHGMSALLNNCECQALIRETRCDIH